MTQQKERIRREKGINASKLTLKEVVEIRKLKGMKQEYLARKFGVQQQTISQILRRKTWCNVANVTPYGKELILDLHYCNVRKFTRKDLKLYFTLVCDLIQMKAEKLVFWDDVGVPIEERQSLEHTKGTTAVQFILTSNITVHTLDLLKSVYINVFSCKDFDVYKVKEFSIRFFESKSVIRSETIVRG